MVDDLWRWLVVATLVSSAAIGLVMLLRKPMRHLVGSRAAYWLWLLPIAVLIACLLPAPVSPFGMAWIIADAGLVQRPDPGVVEAAPDFSPASIGVVIWLLGCAAMSTRLLLSQRRLRRRLGTLSFQGDGTWRSESDPEFGPAVVGLLPARIVLPQSFALMWNPRQQAQVLAHERCHVQRRDLWVQLFALTWLCLFWFNPIVHRAVRLLRADQELACDAAVVMQHPQMIRDYAEALLITVQRDHGAPLCNAWTDPGPIKERMRMLGQSRKNRWVHRAGAAVITTIALLSGVSAWSLQAGGGASSGSDEALLLVDLDFRLLQGAANSSEANGRKLQLLVRPDEESVVSSDDPVKPWRLSLRVSPTPQGHFLVATRVSIDDQVVAAPGVAVLPGKDASIEISNLLRVELRVSPLTDDNDPRTAAGLTNR